jgi:hypothetical protein
LRAARLDFADAEESRRHPQPNHRLSTEMKSAYELAMERLEKQSPTAKLTAAQKAEITELEALTKAKKAEQELFLKGEIEKAEAKGDYEAFEQLGKQLKHEMQKLDEDLEGKKDKVRGKK